MPSVNRITVIGNLGRDCEMRFTPSGAPVTTFSVATNQKYTTGAGEQKEETEWFTIVTWNKLAETCNQYLTKGQLVYVEGRLHSRTWEGQDGRSHFTNEIVASTVRFLSGKPSGAGAVKNSGAEDGGALEPEDLPF